MTAMKETERIIYADNAATTALSETALKAMLPFLKEQYGNASSVHLLGQNARAALDCARERCAQVLGCQAREIIFTSGGTESDNQAICSVTEIGNRQGKKHIISTTIEHHAVLHTLQRLEQQGYEVTLLAVSEEGVVDPRRIAEAIREDTALVSVMYANNEIGTIQPIEEIGRICRDKGVLFHTDAVQAAGALPLGVRSLNADLLSLSAHKFHGPKGAGILYARRGVRLAPLLEGGAQERDLRAGTENVAAIVGMAAALEEAEAGRKTNAERLAGMRDRLIEGLEQISGSVLNGSRTERLSGNVNFSFTGIESEALLLMLDEKGICASAASACSAGAIEPSHVILAIGRPRELAFSSLRLSLSAWNTEEEIDRIIAAVQTCVEELRRGI